MDGRQSYIYTILERLRTYLDEPSLQAKYSNDYLVKHVMAPSQADVLSRLHLTSQAPIILRHTVQGDGETTRFTLPPLIQEVRRVGVLDTNTNEIVSDVWRRDLRSRTGWVWRLEGGPGVWDLVFQEPLSGECSVEIWYTPTAEFTPVYGTATFSEKPTRTFTLLSASLGYLDRRNNAYGGAIFRWLPDPSLHGSEPILESSIESSSFSGGTHTVTLHRTMNPDADTGETRNFEIVAPTTASICEAVATRAALKMSLIKKMTQAQMAMLRNEYLSSLKTAGDQMTYLIDDTTFKTDTTQPTTSDTHGGLPFRVMPS